MSDESQWEETDPPQIPEQADQNNKQTENISDSVSQRTDNSESTQSGKSQKCDERT